MFKRLVTMFLLLQCVPVFAGELENAWTKNKNVFLYLYSENCGYCKMFSPRYNKLSATYNKNYEFVKVDTDTDYGLNLLRKYNGRYIPYVLLLNKNKVVQIQPDCLMDLACVEYEIKAFNK